jgi:alanine racemase
VLSSLGKRYVRIYKGGNAPPPIVAVPAPEMAEDKPEAKAESRPAESPPPLPT